ncbi:TBCC domain-containing protein 1 [Nymphon striatum]|nr:TBCC domain-containing protein 1 [Nymphon striatum]
MNCFYYDTKTVNVNPISTKLRKFHEWKYVCCVKLQIEEKFAVMVYEIFKSFMKLTEGEDTTFTEEPDLNILKFLLLLMVQRINTIRIRPAADDLFDKYPFDNDNEPSQHSFVMDHLGEIVDLITLDDTNGAVSRDAVEVLSFLIEGHIGDESNLVARRPSHLAKAIREDGHLYKDDKNMSRGSAFTNAHVTLKSRKIIILSKILNATFARSSRTLENSYVKVMKCHQSYLYILSYLRSCSIEKCHHSSFVIGSTKLAVQVSGCTECKFIISASHVIISDCSNCTFYLLTPTGPILTGNKNSGIMFAPYNTAYTDLKQQLKKAGISINENLWDHPIAIALNGVIQDEKTWKLMDPSEFYSTKIPFDMPEISEEDKLIVPLPKLYADILQTRQATLNSWNQLLSDSNMNEEQQNELQKRVREHFQAWLKKSGNMLEIESLAK